VNKSDVINYKECVLFLDKHTVSYQSTGRYMDYCQQRENWCSLFLQENKHPILYQHDIFFCAVMPILIMCG